MTTIVSFITATTDEILTAFGARLRAQRLAQELPQSELARMAGLSLGALRKLELDGRCSLETLVRIVQALGLTDQLDALFVPSRHSIAAMERVARSHQRQRAPRSRRR